MIRSFTGPMYSDKSAALIDIYKEIWNKNLLVAFKPRIDERDKDMICSKKYKGEFIPAILVDSISDIKEVILSGNYKTVLIDEAQFLEGDVHDLVDLSVILDIDFYVAGLNMTSEQIPFLIMSQILSVSDEVTIIHGYCQDCNKPSVYSYSLDPNKEEIIKIGNDYISLCPKCLKNRLLKKRDYKILELHNSGEGL